MSCIKILDTTLREGEQTPYVSFTIEQKIEIARLLDNFGVDIIEAGHPAVCPSIKQAVTRIREESLNAEILAHCRAMRSDVEDAFECGAQWVGIFYCISDKRLEEVYRKSEEEATRIITDTIKFAKGKGLKVRYTPEDTVRSDYDKVVRVANAAIEAGADRISVADTAGCMMPWQMYDLVKKFKQDTSVPLSIHCHNDNAMATANAIAAFRAGVDMIDVTVNGLGERTGIAPLAEICTNLKRYFNVSNDWKLDMLQEISQIVANYSGIPIHAQAPIVGELAFTHNAGLHVSAVLANPSHYEDGLTELVGRKRKVVIDKFASKTALRYKLDSLGIILNDEILCCLLKTIKQRDCNALSDSQLLRMVEEFEKNADLK